MNLNETDLSSKGFVKLPDGSWGKPSPSHSRVCPKEPEPAARVPLERATKRETVGKESDNERYGITFTIYRVRPLDWDNSFTKPCQDILVEFGFLPDDNWKVLEGKVRCLKVKHIDEQRTEVTIERI
jgi:hypothetical protein